MYPAWPSPWSVAQASVVLLPLSLTSGLFMLEGPCLLMATSGPSEPHTGSWLNIPISLGFLFLQFKSTPDLLRDQQEATPPGGVDHVKATIYGILREG